MVKMKGEDWALVLVISIIVLLIVGFVFFIATYEFPERSGVVANSINERKCINACNQTDCFVTQDSFVYEGGIGQNHCICTGKGVTNLW